MGSRVQISSRAPSRTSITHRGDRNGKRRKRNHHAAVHRVQTSELLDDQEQEDDDGEARDEEVLPSRAQAHGSPRNEIRRLQANSSIGRAAVSKTAGWGFESLLACQSHRNMDENNKL